MSAMNRIESSAKKANIHARLVSRLPGMVGKVKIWTVQESESHVAGHWPDAHRRVSIRPMLPWPQKRVE
jgi:hypothetical protein